MKKKQVIVWVTILVFLLTACGQASANQPETKAPVTLSAQATANQAAGADGAFSDVSKHDWYAEAVMYLGQNGIMSGTSDTQFSPGESMSRAMLATVLWRIDGQPGTTNAVRFSDVSEDAWCSGAVRWAVQSDIISGYTENTFGPNDPVTREQIAAMLYRYEVYQNGVPASAGDLSFADTEDISDWAKDAAAWTAECDIMTGKPGNLFDPKAPASRAEVAVMLHRYLTADGETPAEPAPTEPPKSEITPDEHGMIAVNITAGGETFAARFYDNPSARVILEQMPFSIEMNDYAGQEKVTPLPYDFPSVSTERPVSIQVGELYLWTGNQLVFFYTTFQNSYGGYVRIGQVNNVAGLTAALGSGSVTVSFECLSIQPSETQGVRAFDFETRTVLLNSGYTMPILGMGTYGLSDEECAGSVTALLNAGGRLIDTAYMYHNEAAVGRAVRESSVPREEIFVITKLYPSQFVSAADAIDEALKKMDIGYIDMLLLHHPSMGDVEAYHAMEQAVADGKVRSIGLSNWYVEELEDFLPQVTITPALVQNEIHPYYQENDVIPYIQDLGIVVQGWYPLGGRGHTAELLGDEVISGIAQAHGVTSAQVILRWNLQKGVVVIPGSSNPDHIRENLELFDFNLTNGEIAAINALDRGEKHDWY